jgi:hypothetical protein
LRDSADVFAGDKEELVSSSFFAALTVGPVLIAGIESFRGISGRPVDDQEYLRTLSLTFELVNMGRASQIAATVSFHQPGHIY